MVEGGPIDPGHGGEAGWLQRWRLRVDGDILTTASSTLIPVVTEGGTAAMLKLSHSEEEERGAALLAAWNGAGAVPVLRLHGEALLEQRATGSRSLVRLVESGNDDDATRILCSTVATLHAASTTVTDAARNQGLPLARSTREATLDLVPLRRWFRELFRHADDLGALHREAAGWAAELLAAPQDEVALHGDIHHGNVLDFGEQGWLAIDPKGLLGERAFDYCNLFCNPSHATALPLVERRFALVTELAGLDARRFARWVVAWCALSSTWFTIDGDEAHAEGARAIGEHARKVLPVD
ncbi:aminoglycoside phosphotransferase family protein [Rathayibacter sp. YIM 133350]|uniref:aminoglycoside phosphotransferase family protein n=1 Tax=Rathayibacter sp. YIM 133350 TaxID=3131992 RepID=UPI00307F9803